MPVPEGKSAGTIETWFNTRLCKGPSDFQGVKLCAIVSHLPLLGSRPLAYSQVLPLRVFLLAHEHIRVALRANLSPSAFSKVAAGPRRTHIHYLLIATETCKHARSDKKVKRETVSILLPSSLLRSILPSKVIFILVRIDSTTLQPDIHPSHT